MARRICRTRRCRTPIRRLPKPRRWAAWSDRCTYRGEWREQVQRSLLTLKALTYSRPAASSPRRPPPCPSSSAGSATGTTAICWLRDATFTLLALVHAGYRDEARAWGAWLRRSVAGTPAQVQTLYGLAGERWLRNGRCPGLAATAGAPGADRQRRERAAAARRLRRADGCAVPGDARRPGASGASWRHAARADRALERDLGAAGREHLGGARRPQHFTFSKAMAWVAMDRAIRGAEAFDLPAPLDELARAAAARSMIRSAAKASTRQKRSFVQYYGADGAGCEPAAAADGRLPASRRPAHHGHRRGDRAGADGRWTGAALSTRMKRRRPAGGEGVFLACSFWLVDNLVLQGRSGRRARCSSGCWGCATMSACWRRSTTRGNRRQLGNFPQAFSHLALINTALNLENHGPVQNRRLRGKAPRRPRGSRS